jgi:hypothetical protein
VFGVGEGVVARSRCRSEDNIKLIYRNIILGLKNDLRVSKKGS